VKTVLRLVGVLLFAVALNGCDFLSRIQDVSNAKLQQLAKNAKPSGTARPAQVVLSGWRLECGSQANGLNCRVFDRMTEVTSNTVLAELSLSTDPKSKRTVLLAQLPLGIVVSDQVLLRVGNRVSQTFPVLTCNRVGCFARDAVHGDLVDAMKSARAPLRVMYNVLDSRLSKRTFTVTLGLGGFSQAYAKLK
jgi:invasion protein IalB